MAAMLAAAAISGCTGGSHTPRCPDGATACGTGVVLPPVHLGCWTELKVPPERLCGDVNKRPAGAVDFGPYPGDGGDQLPPDPYRDAPHAP